MRNKRAAHSARRLLRLAALSGFSAQFSPLLHSHSPLKSRAQSLIMHPSGLLWRVCKCLRFYLQPAGGDDPVSPSSAEGGDVTTIASPSVSASKGGSTATPSASTAQGESSATPLPTPTVKRFKTPIRSLTLKNLPLLGGQKGAAGGTQNSSTAASDATRSGGGRGRSSANAAHKRLKSQESSVSLQQVPPR